MHWYRTLTVVPDAQVGTAGQVVDAFGHTIPGADRMVNHLLAIRWWPRTANVTLRPHSPQGAHRDHRDLENRAGHTRLPGRCFLSLTDRHPDQVNRLVDQLKSAPLGHYKAKDMLRAPDCGYSRRTPPRRSRLGQSKK